MEPSSDVALPHRLYRVLARGFSLVEMMMVLAIITIITTITLLGHSTFDRSLLITDAAYTMALSIRQMQTYGLSSRTFQGTAGSIDYGYGVHISSSTPTTYVLFADTNEGPTADYCPTGIVGTPEEKSGNCLYEAADGLVQRYTLTRGFRVTDICGNDSGTRRCMSTGYLEGIDIVFRRPESDSVINGRRASSAGTYVRLTNAEIYLSTPDRSATRAICVSSVGQISVSSSLCP